MLNRNKGIGGHQSHAFGKDEWLTPPDILKALGPFDLDPCAPINPPWKIADKHFTIDDDGLNQRWEGFVWCNPPYGKAAVRWLNRMAIHGNGIALVFARTETEMFFSKVWAEASSVLFLKGRLHFHHVTGSRAVSNSGAPSVLIAYGDKASDRLRTSNLEGVFISNWYDKYVEQETTD